MDADINFNYIEFKIPLITHMTGVYSGFIYQFTEEGLKNLSSKLAYAHAKRMSEKQ